MTDDQPELLTIGVLAERTGLPVRTIRYWSDIGLVAPTERSAAGYRFYDATATARLHLVRTLRELGLGLGAVRQVLRRQRSVAEVAAMHARALDAEIRTLQLRRAVLRIAAARGSTDEEMTLMNRLARLTAVQRQQIIDDFVTDAFADIDPDAPGAGIASAMRQMPAELSEDPSAEQIDAWVELAELVADPSFQVRVREMAVRGASGSGAAGEPEVPALDPALVAEHAGGALAAGVAPESEQGGVVLARIVRPELTADQRTALGDQLETFTDDRVERYWQLMGVLNDRPAVPSMVPAFEWLIAALRTH